MFSTSRFFATFWARSLEFLRDRSALGWNLIFPLFLVAGLAYTFSGDGKPMFKVAVVGQGQHAFLKAPAVEFYNEADFAAGVKKVGRHRVDLLLDFRHTPAHYWLNPQSQKGLVLEQMLAGSAGEKLQRQAVTGEAVRLVDWLAPGVLGMNMMWSCLFGLGYVIVRYRKSGYLKRLNATPLTALEFILAQLSSRLLLILLITSFVFTASHAILQFRVVGSYGLLLFITLLGAYAMTSMGLVVSARVKSEELAGGLLNLLSWPMLVLSGVFFSLDGAPEPLKIAAQFFPLTHLLDASRAVMLDGAGWLEVRYSLLCLSGMSVLFTVLGAWGFRWTQD
jgi:ABC-type multidrug transport system permease subunit